MNPLGNRARAHELARLLDGAMAGPGSSTAAYATLAMRLRALATAVDPAPAPEFRDALRQRLLAVATVQGVGAVASDDREGSGALAKALAWSNGWKAQRRLAAAAGTMALVVAVSGVGLASSRSLPGQPFYGLKRVAEAVQLSLADGDQEKGTRHLEFAATRLREVRALTRGDGQLAIAGSGTLAGGTALGGSLSSRITSTLEDFREETTEGRELLEGVYRTTGKKEPLRVLTSFARQQQSRLTAILPELPHEATESAQDSLELVTEVGTEANELLGFQACDVGCGPTAPTPSATEEPVPAPGASASPTETPVDDGTGSTPSASPTPEPTPGPTQSPDPEPTPEPTTEPTPTPTEEPGPLPTVVVSELPEPIESLLPTPLPTVVVTLPPLLEPLPAVEVEVTSP